MGIRIVGLVVLTACGPTTTEPTAPPPIDALLVNGQSNAVASVLMLMEDKNEPHLPLGIEGPDIVSWDGAALVQADGDAVGKGKHVGATIGLWAAHLGRDIADASNQTIAIINRGDGGKPIEHFVPGQGNYEIMRDHVLASGVRPRAIVWWQGENDGALGEATSSDEYFAGLCELHAAWTQDYPTVGRFVIVSTSSATCGGDSSEVNDAKQRFADAHPNVVYLDIDDLTFEPDMFTGCHYTYPGYVEIAQRLFLML